MHQRFISTVLCKHHGLLPDTIPPYIQHKLHTDITCSNTENSWALRHNVGITTHKHNKRERGLAVKEREGNFLLNTTFILYNCIVPYIYIYIVNYIRLYRLFYMVDFTFHIHLLKKPPVYTYSSYRRAPLLPLCSLVYYHHPVSVIRYKTERAVNAWRRAMKSE